MNIFFLIESINQIAGTERIAIDLINELSINSNYTITIIAINPLKNNGFRINENVNILSLNINRGSFLKSMLSLRQILKQNNPDFIVNVAVTMSRISIPAAIFTSTKVITWEHFHLYAGSKIGYIWRLISAALSYKTIVLTNKDKSLYPNWLQVKVNTIYNFSKINNSKKADVANSNVVVSVGRLTYQKGFDMLIDVWNIVHKEFPDLKLYIIGDGEDLDKLNSKIKEHLLENFIYIKNTTNEIVKYYKESSLYVMSSRFEGLPLVLIEAKKMGLPCVSFECPNGPSEIIRNNLDGFIVENGNIKMMAEKIIYLFKNREQMCIFGKKACIDAENRFSSKEIVSQWMNLFYK